MLRSPAESWRWVGEGKPDPKPRRARVYYNAVEVSRSVDNSVSTYSVGNTVLMNASESSSSGHKWVAQIVNLYEETPAEYKRKKRHRSIRETGVGVDKNMLVFKHMRCTVRWFENPADLSGNWGRNSTIPEPLDNEYYISDHVEEEGFHGVTEIRGRAWPVTSPHNMEVFFQDPGEHFYEDLDRVCVVRCFVKNVEEDKIRNLDSGELAHVLQNPSLDRNLFETLRMRMLGRSVPFAMKTLHNKRKRTSLRANERPFTPRKERAAHHRGTKSEPKASASDAVDFVKDLIDNTDAIELPHLGRRNTSERERDKNDEIVGLPPDEVEPSSSSDAQDPDYEPVQVPLVTEAGLPRLKSRVDGTGPERQGPIYVSDAGTKHELQSDDEDHEVQPQRDNRSVQSRLCGHELQPQHDGDVMEVIVISDGEDECEDYMKTGSHGTEQFALTMPHVKGEPSSGEIEPVIPEAVADRNGSQAYSNIDKSLLTDDVTNTEEDRLELNMNVEVYTDLQRDIDVNGHCDTRIREEAETQKEEGIRLNAREDVELPSVKVMEAVISEPTSVTERGNRLFHPSRESDADTEVDTGEDVKEILSELKAEYEKMEDDKQELFFKGMHAALDLAIAKVRQYGISVDVDPEDDRVRSIVREVLDLCTGTGTSVERLRG